LFVVADGYYLLSKENVTPEIERCWPCCFVSWNPGGEDLVF